QLVVHDQNASTTDLVFQLQALPPPDGGQVTVRGTGATAPDPARTEPVQAYRKVRFSRRDPGPSGVEPRTRAGVAAPAPEMPGRPFVPAGQWPGSSARGTGAAPSYVRSAARGRRPSLA